MCVMATDRDAGAPLRGRTILSDEVFSVISDAIREGRLSAGQIIRDQDLATQLGVSRTPVREALQRLARMGLVEIAANRFTRVAMLDDAQRADSREFIVYMMGAALQMSTRRASDEELTETVALFDEIIDASDRDDYAELVRSSIRFYRRLTGITRNHLFVAVMGEAALLFERNLVGWTPHLTDTAERRESYVALRAAIMRRDGAGAERIFRHQHGYAV